jgi:hypothetical protein
MMRFCFFFGTQILSIYMIGDLIYTEKITEKIKRTNTWWGGYR